MIVDSVAVVKKLYFDAGMKVENYVDEKIGVTEDDIWSQGSCVLKPVNDKDIPLK